MCRISHGSLKVASALNVIVMAIPTGVVASELWLRDDLEEVYALLFQFLGKRLPAGALQRGLACDAKVRHSGARSHLLSAVAVLLDCTASFVSLVNTSSWPPFAGLFVIPRNKDDTGDGVPTDQLSHNHCDCTDIVSSCACASRPNRYHKTTTAGTFHNVYFSQAARHGQAM